MLSNLFHELWKIVFFLMSLPKSFIFNFYYLPFGQAIKLPILISSRVKLRYMGGSIQVDNPSFGMIQIGLNSFGDILGVGGSWNLKGDIHFQGRTRIGCNPIIQIDGKVTIGKGFEAGHNLLIICDENITIGEGVLLSWHVELMDTDSHKILDKSGNILNQPCPITIHDASWLGSHVCILKGANLPIGSIVSSHAVVTKEFYESHSVLIGSPASVKKSNLYWKP